jgi:hypothetical protein
VVYLNDILTRTLADPFEIAPTRRILQRHSRSLTRGDAFEIVQRVVFFNVILTPVRSLMPSKSPNEWYSSTPFTRSLTFGDALQIAQQESFVNDIGTARSPMPSKSPNEWYSLSQ